MILTTRRGIRAVVEAQLHGVKPSPLHVALGECGYHILTVDQSRSRNRRRDSVIVVNPNDWSGAMWLYTLPSGTTMVRPWITGRSFDLLLARLAAKRYHNFKLRKGVPMKVRHGDPVTWVSWLSPAEKQRLKLLGYIG